MAMSGGYAVLAYYDSSSSNKVYQVRRGGDGVLYCTCQGWISNLNANKRSRSPDPAKCRHTKDYVAEHPGTSYGPQWFKAASLPTVQIQKKKAAVAMTVSPPSLVSAAADWRAVILNETRAAASRGVVTPREALTAFACDLDLGDVAALTVTPRAAAHDLDID